MPAIDFTTALARLLQDGALRDELANHPESLAQRLGLRGSDRAALLSLDPLDLECQAEVLLRKRLDSLRDIIPITSQRLGNALWPLFCRYARNYWPTEKPIAVADAHAFCSSLKTAHGHVVSQSEWNRLRFVFFRRRFAVHLVPRDADHRKTAVQILSRFRSSPWHELLVYVRL